MKTIILAGGYGTRLGTITETIPKPMVFIGNRPILWHIMKIYSHYGYNDFIISLGYKAEVIKNYFYHFEANTCDFTINLSTRNITIHSRTEGDNWTVTLVDTGINSLKGARIKRLDKHLDDINMVTYGDGVANINIQELVDFHKKHKKIITVTGVHPPSRFGEIAHKSGRLIFEEKPQTSVGLINGGFMVFNRNLLEYLTEDEDCDLEYGPFNQLASEEQIMVFEHKGLWECIDHERDMNHLNELWKTNMAFWKVWS
jgi:glucose-1-phosphate cytidylyltransferase